MLHTDSGQAVCWDCDPGIGTVSFRTSTTAATGGLEETTPRTGGFDWKRTRGFNVYLMSVSFWDDSGIGG